MPDQPKAFTLDELRRHDGKDGRPAYVAHDGIVHDLSGSPLWKEGRHMNRHEAGLDLSVDLSQAPHGPDMLARFPIVGVVHVSCAAGREAIPDARLPWILRRNPVLRRHPHPMTVHFPIAFSFGAAASAALYWLTGSPLWASAVQAMVLVGAAFTPVTILTGLATWKYVYGARLMAPIKAKLALSLVLLAQFAACLMWWFNNPEVLSGGGTDAALFSWLVASLVPVVTVMGWLGARLTFPLHR